MNINRKSAGKVAYILFAIGVASVPSVVISGLLTSCHVVPGNNCDSLTTPIHSLIDSFIVMSSVPFWLGVLFGLLNILLNVRTFSNEKYPESFLPPSWVKPVVWTGRILLGLAVLIWAGLIMSTMNTGDGAFLGSPTLGKAHPEGFANTIRMVIVIAHIALTGAIASGILLFKDWMFRTFRPDGMPR